MAINIPIISEFQDKGIKAAKAAFANFKTAVADAEGGMNKFNAGSKVAMDAVAANAGIMAVAAGAAIGKFVLNGMNAFQDLAISAGKFADATGLTVQDASRYIEVAGDIGLPIDAVETAIGKLNKTIGANPDKVRNLGIDLVYLKDGSLDVNETLKNTIDRLKSIKDPAERAAIASQLLGKGWQSMSELIMEGSTKLDESLKKVSDQKIISESELKMAQDYRDAMNNLGDAAEDVKIKSGQRLIPIVTFATRGISKLFELDAALTELGKDMIGNGTQSPNTELIDMANNMRDARRDTDDFRQSIKDARIPLNDLTEATKNATVALNNADTAWKVLTGSLDKEVALDNAKTKLAELEAAAKLAFGTGAQADIDAYEQQAADFATMLSAISGNMDDISSKEILIRYKTQGPAAALELAGYLARGAEAGKYQSQFDLLTLAGISGGTRASGGPVEGGSTYLVGEKGPELFTPSSSGNISPNGSFGGNGGTINITVTSADPNAVVRALQSYNRNVGKIPVSVQ